MSEQARILLRDAARLFATEVCGGTPEEDSRWCESKERLLYGELLYKLFWEGKLTITEATELLTDAYQSAASFLVNEGDGVAWSAQWPLKPGRYWGYGLVVGFHEKPRLFYCRAYEVGDSADPYDRMRYRIIGKREAHLYQDKSMFIWRPAPDFEETASVYFNEVFDEIPKENP